MQRKNTPHRIETIMISPHPDNPRKDLGDLTELTESIKKNGILQEITVMPYYCLNREKEDQRTPSLVSDDGYTVLLGHRRLAAAKAAGLKKINCNIVWELSRAEQIGLMMEENVQRNELTIPEQIESFQLMLDLGESVESVAQKTGFSKSTIYKRIRNKDIVEELKESSYQFTIADMEELAKVEDPEEKKAIAQNAQSSANIKASVDEAIRRKERNEKLNATINMVKAAGAIEWTEDLMDQYGRWWNLERVESIPFGQAGVQSKWRKYEKVFFQAPSSWSRELEIRGYMPESEEEETEEERQERERDEKRRDAVKRLEDKETLFISGIDDFLVGMLDGRYKDECDGDFGFELYRNLINGIGIDPKKITATAMGEDYWNISKDDIKSFFESTKPDVKTLLLATEWTTLSHDIVGYNGEYNAGIAVEYRDFTEKLGAYGYTVPIECEMLLDGTDELYRTAAGEFED